MGNDKYGVVVIVSTQTRVIYDFANVDLFKYLH